MEGSVKKRWVGRGIETSERERDSEKSRVAKKRIGEPPCRGPFRGRLGVMSTGLAALPHVGRKRTALRAFQAQ